MSNLFYRFCKPILAYRFWLVCLCSVTMPALAEPCNTSPIFAFSRALYLDDYRIAQDLLLRIQHERSAEIAQFLQQVLIFKRAYEQGKTAQQKAALEAIDALIDSLSDKVLGQDGVDDQLMLANITIHSARLQLAVGKVLRAATLAKQGKQLLDKLSEQAPNQTDALLSKGLYAYYTGSENETLGWMMRWWSLQGDKVAGREMMERAVEESADYAFEAARSLLLDTAWSRQNSCRYRPLFNRVDVLKIPSIDAAKTNIALALFCGNPDDALVQINALNNKSKHASKSLSQAHSDWLFAAQLYALAAQGNAEQLQVMLMALDAKVDDYRYWQTQFSLAKALDTMGRHKKAAGLYQEIIESSLKPSYRQLARAYQQVPYQKPRLFKQRPEQVLQFACVNE